MINRSGLSVIFLFLAGLTLFGQAKVKWEGFRADPDGLSLQVPFQLETSGDAKNDSPRFYHGQGDRIWLYVFSERANKEQRIKTVRQFLESNGQSLAFGTDPKHPLVLAFKDSDNYWHRIAAFRLSGREILLQGVSDEIGRSVIEKFTSSFKAGITQATANESPDRTTDIAPIDQNRVPGGARDSAVPTSAAYGTSGSAYGTGSKTASGWGNGNGSGIGPGHTTGPPVTGVSSPLRILSKPKAAFTNYARVYEMTGGVLLRVTFLKEGEIGSISMIHGLPFGLTQAAVDSAKRLRFEPAVVNGTPVTVTKTVEYTFTLY